MLPAKVFYYLPGFQNVEEQEVGVAQFGEVLMVSLLLLLFIPDTAYSYCVICAQ